MREFLKGNKMTDNLRHAISILKGNGKKLVLTDGITAVTSDVRGVFSLLDLIEKKEYNLNDFSAADKVIGRGAALLYAKMKIREVHGSVMSEKAKEIFELYSVPFSYDTLVPCIINRNGDGMCPVEKATEGITDCEKAYQIIKDTVNYKNVQGISVSVPVLKKKKGEKRMKKLGFGCMRLPLTDKKDDSSVDIEQVKEMVDAYLAEGFNYFDTAYMYHKGKSECFVKEALVKRHPRESFYLADKLPVGMMKCAEDKEKIFLEQKEKCGVDYFDYYLLHCLDKKNFKAAEKYGVFEYLSGRKQAGEIKNLGFSFHDTADVLDEILTKHPETEFVQLQINYLDWENEKVQSRLCYEVARKHGTPIIVMEPVRGGALANVPGLVKNMFAEKDISLSVASWAIRFAASLEGVFMVLSGMSDMAQLKDNMSYMSHFVPLTEEEKALCLKAGSVIANKDTVPCTACRYCAEECPIGIAIPELLALYNKKINGDEVTVKEYTALTAQGSPADCIRCKKCEKMCPQKIKIADMMKKIKKKF